jgi:putative ABC transport system substrate-binding protein
MTELQQALQQLGWSSGQNIHIDSKYSGADPSRLPQLAKELVALNPDVIVAHTTPAVVALQKDTSTIPIVFVNVSDPIGSGFVASLPRPGRNITGVMLYEDSITGKWLAMLKEIAPNLARVALMANPKTTPYDYFLRSAKAIALSLAIELVPTPIENADDIQRKITSFASEPRGGLLVLPDGTSILHRDLVVALLPAVYAFRFFVTAGGLMSYGTDVNEQFRQVASYIDRILRGAHPRDLPIEAPTKYQTVLNLKTAKALGLEVPPSLIVRADEVIE